MEPKDDLSLTELLAPYREKIAETWAEVLLSDAQQIGRWVAVGKLFNEAKAKGRAAGKNWTTEIFPALCPKDKPMGIGKAEKLMGIADEPLIADDSSDRTNFPAHINTLNALRKVDKQVGKPGTLARWKAGELIVDGEKVTMHADLKESEVDAIVAKLAPPADVDPNIAARDVAKTLGLKPGDPMVKDALAKMGVQTPPAPPAKPVVEKKLPVEKKAAPFKQDRWEVLFRKAVWEDLSTTLFSYLEGCPKGLDPEGLAYRLFPERELKELFPKFLSLLEQRREWIREAEWVDNKWVPPMPKDDGQPSKPEPPEDEVPAPEPAKPAVPKSAPAKPKARKKARPRRKAAAKAKRKASGKEVAK